MTSTRRNYVDILKPTRIANSVRNVTLHTDKSSSENLMIPSIQRINCMQINCSCMKIVIRIIVGVIIDISSNPEEDLMVVDSEEADQEAEVVIEVVVVVDTIKEINNMDMANKTKVVTITKQ